MYYSFPRSTTDADFVIGTADFDIQSLSNSLGSEFKFDPQLSFETIGGSIKNEIQIVGSPFRIELFRLTDQAFDQVRFERRQKSPLQATRFGFRHQKTSFCKAHLVSPPRQE